MPTRIKGATIIANVALFRELMGMARLNGAIGACPPETQQLLRRTLVAVEWIPADSWGPFLQVVYEQLFRCEEQQFRKVMRAVCKREFTTLYRAFLNHATPGILAAKTEAIWRAYFDTGVLRVDNPPPDEGPARCVVQLRDLETKYPVYALAIQAYIEQVVAMVGTEKVLVQRTGETLTGGRLSCDYLVSTTPT